MKGCNVPQSGYSLILTTQRIAIVTTIRCSYYRVRMELRRLGVIEENARMMVEFTHDNGALNSEVECIIVTKSSNPAEIRLGKELGDMLELHAPRLRRQIQKVLL